MWTSHHRRVSVGSVSQYGTWLAVLGISLLSPRGAFASDETEIPPLMLGPVVGFHYPLQYGGIGLETNLHLHPMLNVYGQALVGASEGEVSCDDAAYARELGLDHQCGVSKLAVGLFGELYMGVSVFSWSGTANVSVATGYEPTLGGAMVSMGESSVETDEHLLVEVGGMTGPLLLIDHWHEPEGVVKARQVLFPTAGLRYLWGYEGVGKPQVRAWWLHALGPGLGAPSGKSGPVGVKGGFIFVPWGASSIAMFQLEAGYLPTYSVYGNLSGSVPLFF
ncbi:MAG: hypothetical protein JW940_23840 [Polyangiaceae bacterium]|nr:hypothetical protein [Polyangiaceae bacterium]